MAHRAVVLVTVTEEDGQQAPAVPGVSGTRALPVAEVGRCSHLSGFPDLLAGLAGHVDESLRVPRVAVAHVLDRGLGAAQRLAAVLGRAQLEGVEPVAPTPVRVDLLPDVGDL